jgi:circadian clock protein KaiC
LRDAYLGQTGVLTGSARLIQETRETLEQQAAIEESTRTRLAFEHRRRAVEAQVNALRASFQAETEEFERQAANARLRQKQVELDRQKLSVSRKATKNRKGTT